jgi:hypothetical protein
MGRVVTVAAEHIRLHRGLADLPLKPLMFGLTPAFERLRNLRQGLQTGNRPLGRQRNPRLLRPL